MTSDAKIGLLLGLVLIFIIAFVVNGLPDFRKDAGSNELTINMVERQLGLAERERQVSRHVISPQPYSPPTPEQDVRFVAELPGANPDTPPSIIETADARQTPPAPTQSPQLPTTYTAQDGDMLSTIAKKFYGPEEGNRLVNIKRIYEANKQTLRSPDDIRIGQKIVIPPLPSAQTAPAGPENTLVSRIFETVQSIGQRHLSADQPQQQSQRYYVVKDKDNLWKIAAAELGDGKRYTEIHRLNSDLLEDSDNISIGLRLKLPVR
jgi:nucleoid-associated protein YgaU